MLNAAMLTLNVVMLSVRLPNVPLVRAVLLSVGALSMELTFRAGS
jgi:hypothetical protein